MLAIAVLLAAALSSEPSEIVLREPLFPITVQTTITSQCGSHDVSIRMESAQGQLGSRVTGLVVGDDTLSGRDLDRLAAAIGRRDIISAAVVKCGEEVNLDKVSIVIEMAEHPAYSSKTVGLEITEDGVEIDRA